MIELDSPHIAMHSSGQSEIKENWSKAGGGLRTIHWICVLLSFSGLNSVFAFAQDAAPPITALTFAPEFNHVLSGSQSGIVIRSAVDESHVNSHAVPFANVHDIAFSPNGQQIAVAGGNPAETGAVAIYNWPSMEHVLTLELHTDSVYDISWSADSRTIATASLDHDVVIADTSTAQVKSRLQGHSKGVTAVEFIAENTLASAGIDQSIRIWDLKANEIVRTLNNHTHTVQSISLWPLTDGLPVMVSISKDRTVRFWQPTTGRMVRFARLNEIPVAVRWHPEEQFVFVVTENGKLYEIDYATAAVRWKVTASSPQFADHSVDKWCNSFAIDFQKSTILFGGTRGSLVVVRDLD